MTEPFTLLESAFIGLIYGVLLPCGAVVALIPVYGAINLVYRLIYGESLWDRLDRRARLRRLGRI